MTSTTVSPPPLPPSVPPSSSPNDLLLFISTGFDFSIKKSGPILVVAGNGLVCYVAYEYFAFPLVPASVPLMEFAAWTIPGLFLWFNICFNWILCYYTDPGSPPADAPPSFHGEFRKCRKCEKFKPPRTHHCSICRRCIMGFDHHCPWMATCIGFRNYRYFFLTLLYLVIGAIYVICLDIYYHDALGRVLRNEKLYLPHAVLLTFMLSSAAGFAVSVLLIWHMHLIFTGQTTIEMMERQWTAASRGVSLATYLVARVASCVSCGMCGLRRGGGLGRGGRGFFGTRRTFPLPVHDYDLGWRRNVENIFGTSNLLLAVMPSVRVPRGDGVTWDTCQTLVSSIV